MNTGSYTVEHQCPQCGAPIIIDEGDHLLACRYCRTRLFLNWNQYCSYYLVPHETSSPDSLVFVPYWRFRGIGLALNNAGINHRVIDLSVRASDFRIGRESLGMRPQALRLRLVKPGDKGRFLPVSMKKSELEISVGESFIGIGYRNKELQDMLGSSVAKKESLFYQAVIGEIVSLIYAPFFRVNGKYYDGITLDPVDASKEGDLPGSVQISSADFQFLPVICPNCGWDLQAQKDCVVLTCSNCNSGWRPGRQGLKQVEVFHLNPRTDADLWAPFWVFDTECTGFELRSYADFIRLANIAKAVTPRMESRRFRFWIPAFKINPATFVRLGCNMILHQQEPERPEFLTEGRYCSANLSAADAFESAPVILGAASPAKKKLFPLIKHGKIEPKAYNLTFVPFKLKGPDYVQPDFGFSIPASALRWSEYI